MALTFPDIDPVALRLGPLAIRWYAIAYIVGLLSGWQCMRRLVARPPHALSANQLDDFLVWVTLGVVLGGRLGYVLFYKPLYYLQDPSEIIALWKGGMSFHGGALGVILAIILYSRRQKISYLAVGDAICTTIPIGLFFGRIANFVNGELFGRPAPADLPWAMIFPTGGPIARHPSQLYEAGLEGLILFTVMILLWRLECVRLRPGTLSGIFLLGYGIARSIAEMFRQPDSFLGFLWGGLTMGQLLSIPLMVAGVIFILRAQRRPG